MYFPLSCVLHADHGPNPADSPFHCRFEEAKSRELMAEKFRTSGPHPAHSDIEMSLLVKLPTLRNQHSPLSQRQVVTNTRRPCPQGPEGAALAASPVGWRAKSFPYKTRGQHDDEAHHQQPTAPPPSTMSTLNEEERGEQELDEVRQRLSEALSKATHRPFDTRAKVPTDCQMKGDKTLGPAIILK
jgi:hypothetical protein